MGKTIGLFAILMIGMAYAGYAEAGGPDEVVVSVDGVKLLRKDVDSFVNSHTPSPDTPTVRYLEERKILEHLFIDIFIMSTVFKLEAEREGISITAEDRRQAEKRAEALLKTLGMTLEDFFKSSALGFREEAARKQFEDGIFIEKLLQVKVYDRIVIDDAEVEAIIKEAKKEQNARAEIAQKLREKIAAEEKQMEKRFGRSNNVSNIVGFEDGVTTDEPLPDPIPTADEIREQLKLQRRPAARDAYLNELKAKAKIEIFTPSDE